MEKLLLRLVSGQANESLRIQLLLGFGFSLGIFGATYFVASEALFISRLNPDVMAPRAFFAQGVFGTLVAAAFVFIQRRLSYKNVALISTLVCLFFIWVVTIISFFRRGDLPEEVIFFAFVVYKPIVATLGIVFWGIFGRLFSLRAVKRLASGIDSGLALSSIVSFFSLPMLKPLFGTHLENFFWISSLSLSFGAVMVYFLGKQEFEGERSPLLIEVSEQDKEIFSLRRSRYVRLLSLFVASSVLAASVVDYNFLNVSKMEFAVEADLTNFLSYFSGLVMVVAFITQVFLNDKILDVYGVKVSLLILPGILLIFGIASTVIGHLFGFESSQTDMFLLYFIIAAIAKLFSDALRDSLEAPTIKLFFLPLPTQIRFSVQTFVEGTVKEFAILASGLILMGLGLLNFFNLLWYTYFLFVVLGIWAVAVVFTYAQYRQILTRVLASNKLKRQSAAANNFNIRQLFAHHMDTQDELQARFMLNLVERIDPALLEEAAANFRRWVPSRSARVHLLQKVQKHLLYKSIPALKEYIQTGRDPFVVQMAQQTLEQLETARHQAQSITFLTQKAYSPNVEDRLYAAQIISEVYNDKNHKLLLPLLRDSSLQVRRAALASCGQSKIEEFLPIVVDCLNEVGLKNQAISALVDYGAMALPVLDKEFYRKGVTQNTMVDIVRTIGFIGGEQAVRILLRKFDYPDRKVWREVLYSLSRCNWRAEEGGTAAAIIRNFLENEINNCIWNQLAISELEDSEYTMPLRQALEDEVRKNFEEIYLYLGLLYDKSSVALVRENAESGTSDGLGYALELLDVMLDDGLKRRLMPIIDDISLKEKINRLEIYYPRDSYNSYEVLVNVLNRDFNDMGNWAKACALYALLHRPEPKIIYEMVSLLFCEDELLHQMAAYCIAKIDPKQLEFYARRLPKERIKATQKTIAQALLPGYDPESRDLIFEKVLFLLSTPAAKGLSGDYLAELLVKTEERFIPKGTTLSHTRAFEPLPILIVIKGEITAFQNKIPVATFGAKEVLNEILYPVFDLTTVDLVATQDTRVYEIDSNKFFEDMADSYQFTEIVVNNVLRRLATSESEKTAESVAV